MYFVHILECCDGSYYVGHAADVSARFVVHCSGKGPSYTANRLPVRLVYEESFTTLNEAVRREKQLKGWSRAKKESLISGDLTRLRSLSGCDATRQGVR
ncbi:MAG: GIY-YIG nuclease family protein [Planctomycetes bacterium]|nr:GIY-YIG nuclease family protein [Planctomycetota bacterium]